MARNEKVKRKRNLSMFDLSLIGRWLIYAGLGMAILGGLIWMADKADLPLGRLPGDLRIERDGVRYYFPVASCLLLSVLLTIGMNMIMRLWRK